LTFVSVAKNEAGKHKEKADRQGTVAQKYLERHRYVVASVEER